MKKKQISIIILAAAPMILASCQSNGTSVAASGDAGSFELNERPSRS
jgi:uncharacterized lipoprotein YajG